MSDKTIHINDLPPLDKKISHRMSKEMTIILWLIGVYLVYLLAVPVLTFLAPGLMKIRISGGMSLTWFLTSIGAMIMAFVIAVVHVFFYTKDFYISEDSSEKISKGAGM